MAHPSEKNDKRCFVIMPITEGEGYDNGHFRRVYDHILKPAIELAGFNAVRADDIMTTNYIALDIIKNILECEMAVCDLSSRNPNVLYELGIRQSFNLPVTLIKDAQTSRVFDIQGIRDIEYNESLRIDTVETTIADLSEVIKNTYENRDKEINSLISLLGIEPAKPSEKKKISTDTELILNSLASMDRRMSLFEELTKYMMVPSGGISGTSGGHGTIVPGVVVVPTQKTPKVGGPLSTVDIAGLKIEDQIFHPSYGIGTIMDLTAAGSVNRIVSVEFSNGVRKSIQLNRSIGRQYRKVLPENS